jgi:protocatechuate 3,4-dioxygenase beta subunit
VRDSDLDSERRRFLRLAVAAPIVFAAGVKLHWPADAAPGPSQTKPPERVLAPTPDCGDDDEPTPTQTAGPFFKPRSPLRASLVEPGMAGTPIVLSGRVFARDCRPVAGALLDFWHADDEGEYDNAGFRLRGHQFADAQGRWKIETIVPGVYPGRTRHFHVRVQPKGGRVLTTQLYFPDEPRNRRDFLFDPELLMAVREQDGRREGRFHFVLATG